MTAVIRRPSSCANSTARLFQVPAVSIATGTKMWLLASCLYLASYLEAALSAAAPAVVAVSARCESAYNYYYYLQMMPRSSDPARFVKLIEEEV